jgi:hypothetical protein
VKAKLTRESSREFHLENLISAYIVSTEKPWLYCHRGLAEAVFAVFYFGIERDSLAREGEKRGAEEANTR